MSSQENHASSAEAASSGQTSGQAADTTVRQEMASLPSTSTQELPNTSNPQQSRIPTVPIAMPAKLVTCSDLENGLKKLNMNRESPKESDKKGKNAKKKEKLKLKIEQNKMQQQPLLQPMSAPANINPNLPKIFQNHQWASNNLPSNLTPQNSLSVHCLFSKCISPLYNNVSTKYLDTLAKNSRLQRNTNNEVITNVMQLQHQQVMQQQLHQIQLQALCQQRQRQLMNIAPLGLEAPPYIKNALQHPLLSNSYIVYNQMWKQRMFNTVAEGHRSAIDNKNQNSSPRTSSKNNSKQSAEAQKFEPHLTREEVEEGLKTNKFIEGVIRINPKQFQHSYVTGADRSEQDIFIDGIKYRNRALEGDVVVVQMIEGNEEDGKKRGKVVYIKEKIHTRLCIGTLKLMPDKNRQRALFIPRDNRVPRLNIQSTSWPDDFYKNSKSYVNTLFSAKILDWFDTRFALGNIDRLIGQSGDMVTESKAILAQNDLDITPFGADIRDLFPRLDYVIPTEELEIREDCRKLCIFSIDPFNCRDIDDAVSCRMLENGNYEIGVHISDVTHFLTEDTKLDEIVSMKATTIYLVDRAYHMLPDELCLLCSLFPGVDKLAFSVFWEITKDAKVLSHRFAKTVIHSCSQLAYEHAQDIIDGKEANDFPDIFNGFKYEDIRETIKVLNSIAEQFRDNRFNGGALRIDQPKISFRLSPTTGLPESFTIYDSKKSHQLIEEFMLLANMTVANRIYEDHPNLAFLRCHPPPSVYMMRQLEKSLKPMGIDIDISSAGSLHRSLLPYVGSDNTDKGRAMVLNMLCAKPMTRAKYFCSAGVNDEDFAHYALNVSLYTHFTSPIRRYADIMVHRLLAASLKCRDVPTWDVDRVKAVAAQCNKQKYNAKKAGEMSIEVYTLKYIELNSPVVTEAVVVDIREKFIDVIVVAMGLNRRIFFNSDFPGKFNRIRNEESVRLAKMELVWNATDTLPEKAQVIEVFSVLNVELFKGDDMVKVETKIIRPTD